METIILSENDNRLGRFAPDGSYASWPAVNLDGGRYEHINAIVQRTGDYFVVIPPNRDAAVEVKVGDITKMMIEPPDEAPVMRRKEGK